MQSDPVATAWLVSPVICGGARFTDVEMRPPVAGRSKLKVTLIQIATQDTEGFRFRSSYAAFGEQLETERHNIGNSQNNPGSTWLARVCGVLTAISGASQSVAGEPVSGLALFDEIVRISPPARPGANEPSLTSKDATHYMSWLKHGGDYTRVMMSAFQGRNWAEARQVHVGADLFVNWADFPDAMRLRATTRTRAGVLDRDVAIDTETCSCCQTGLAATGNGGILAAYRDRREGEILDVSVAQLTAEGWQVPSLEHRDGWELPGCPVNGPAIVANGDTASVARFTGAGGSPAVKVAFSDDAGQSFGVSVRVEQGDPAGRVDLQLMEDNSALVSCRVNKTTGCVAPEILFTNSAVESVNFPRMVRLGREVYIAWTQSDVTGDRVEMRRATLAEAE